MFEPDVGKNFAIKCVRVNFLSIILMDKKMTIVHRLSHGLLHWQKNENTTLGAYNNSKQPPVQKKISSLFEKQAFFYC